MKIALVVIVALIAVLINAPTSAPVISVDTSSIAATATPAAASEPAQTPVPVEVTANGEWTPVHRDFDGFDMVLVPPGCFMMGSENGDEDEQPVNEVCIDKPYWIDAMEATNAQFEPFQTQFSYPGNFFGPDQPRDYLDWFEAARFCALRGVRLPTEAEWEYAARGPDGLTYPWGDEFVEENAVCRANSNNSVADVGSRPGGASWVGALDMIGNVPEWTSSEFKPYPYDASDGRETPAEAGDTDKRVIRGGTFLQPAELLTATFRDAGKPRGDFFYVYVGVRCARDVSE
jgi:formylglycine-generating enzyme required for sulfatase activity